MKNTKNYKMAFLRREILNFYNTAPYLIVSFFNRSIEALAIILRPINKTIKLVIAQMHITAAIGMAVSLLNKLTNAVEIAPMPS